MHCFLDPGLLAQGQTRITWSLDGQDLGPLPAPALHDGPNGQTVGWLKLQPPGGGRFAPGIYQLRLVSGDSVLAEASFAVAAGAEAILARKAPPAAETTILELRTVTGVTGDGWPMRLTEQFRPTDGLWVWFRFANGVPGGAFEVRWLYRGRPIAQATTQIPMRAESGWGHAHLTPAGATPLPPGPYEAQVLLAGGKDPLARVAFSVLEPGREPKTRPAPSPPPPTAGAASPTGATERAPGQQPSETIEGNGPTKAN